METRRNAVHEFQPIPLVDGPCLQISSPSAFGPICIQPFSGQGHSRSAHGGETTYGIVTGGTAQVVTEHGHWMVPAGMFFAAPGAFTLEGGRGLLITQSGYMGMPLLGGPIEDAGRLRYIDGCTDTVLVPPLRRGDPCLNHLHIPPGVRQTPHTHPSDRIGVILRGRGTCVTGRRRFDLLPGMGWRIPANTVHCFETTTQELDVVAWHPDSDFGPTDEDHPMKNRTLVGGVSRKGT